MENQLIVYTPKKNVKKIVTTVLLGIMLSFLIFLTSAISSTAICCRIKWNQPVNLNAQRGTSTLDVPLLFYLRKSK